MSSLAKQKQEKQMNGYLLSFGVCAAAAIFIFLPFLVVDKGLFQYCGDFNSQQIPFYTYTVSYTHLDVYKRQAEDDLAAALRGVGLHKLSGYVALELFLLRLVQLVQLGPHTCGPVPVSYTHLDVYKRQPWSRAVKTAM